MHNLYMSEYGDVRISDSELSLLRLEHEIITRRVDDDPRWQTLLLKAGYLRADCERVALHKWLAHE